MLDRKGFLKIFPIVFILMPFLILIIMIYAFGLTILSMTSQSAHIEASQLKDGEVTLGGI